MSRAEDGERGMIEAMANISLDGEVTINWGMVEEAANKERSQNWYYAKLMLAIRDGTWKPPPASVS